MTDARICSSATTEITGVITRKILLTLAGDTTKSLQK